MRTAVRCSAFILTLFVPCGAFIVPESKRRLLLAQRALCRQRNAPADCCCRTTPGPCTFPRSDIHQHVRSFLSSKRKGKESQLRLAQRTVLGQQAHPELPLDAWKASYVHHIPVAAFFPLQPAQRRQMAVLSAPASSVPSTTANLTASQGSEGRG